jgi:hypothetical protein
MGVVRPERISLQPPSSLLKHVEKPRSSALKSQKKQLLVPPAKAGGKEEPAEARLKIAPNDVRFIAPNDVRFLDSRNENDGRFLNSRRVA